MDKPIFHKISSDKLGADEWEQGKWINDGFHWYVQGEMRFTRPVWMPVTCNALEDVVDDCFAYVGIAFSRMVVRTIAEYAWNKGDPFLHEDQYPNAVQVKFRNHLGVLRETTVWPTDDVTIYSMRQLFVSLYPSVLAPFVLIGPDGSGRCLKDFNRVPDRWLRSPEITIHALPPFHIPHGHPHHVCDMEHCISFLDDQWYKRSDTEIMYLNDVRSMDPERRERALDMLGLGEFDADASPFQDGRRPDKYTSWTAWRMHNGEPSVSNLGKKPPLLEGSPEYAKDTPVQQCSLYEEIMQERLRIDLLNAVMKSKDDGVKPSREERK